MQIGHNPFPNFSSLSARQTIDVALPKTTSSAVSAHSARNIRDEYVSSSSDSSGAYKLPAPMKLSQSSFEAMVEKHSNTLTGRVCAALNKVAGEVSESFGLEGKSITLLYTNTNEGGIVFTGGIVYSFPPDGAPDIPLSSEQKQAYRDAFKTTIVEGKSLAEWDATPKHDRGGFLYYEDDPELGKFVSFKHSTVMGDLFKTDSVEEALKNLDRLLKEGVAKETLDTGDVELEDEDSVSAALDEEGEYDETYHEEHKESTLPKKLREQGGESEESDKPGVWMPGPGAWQPGSSVIPEQYRQERNSRFPRGEN